MSIEETGTLRKELFSAKIDRPLPSLFVAYAPPGAAKQDWLPCMSTVMIGRSKEASLQILETLVSREHFLVHSDGKSARIEDLGSKNGTFVNRQRVTTPMPLPDQAVILAGRTLFVFHADARAFVKAANTDRHGIVGRFHAPVLADVLGQAAHSARNLLLAGPSGSGKELAAQAIADLMGKPLVVQNAARFSSEEEAASTLFGVGAKVFSDVKERAGYIERAQGGILFLDEVHNLPRRVQKSLLRVIEDKRLARIGQTDGREIDVRFVFASNEPPKKYGLVKDLLARLRVVPIPSLKERLADIPDIFDHLLTKALKSAGLEVPPLDEVLNVRHYEALMHDGFPDDNARGLYDLADRIVTAVGSGAASDEAAGQVFTEHFRADFSAPLDIPPDMVGRTTLQVPIQYAAPRGGDPTVEEAYHRLGGNVAAIVRDLRSRGIECSRKTVSRRLDELGLPRVKRGRG